jgi:hypothetical protein
VADRGSDASSYWQWRLTRLEQAAARRYVPPHRFAQVLAVLGDHDAALDRLEQAYDERDQMELLKVSPYYDPFRSHPRFQQLVARVGFPD